MPLTTPEQRYRERKRQRERKRKLRRYRRIVFGVFGVAIFMLGFHFFDRHWNANSSARQTRVDVSDTLLKEDSANRISAASDYVLPREEESKSVEIQYITKEEKEQEPAEKKQTEHFTDVLDCFLVTKTETPLYRRNSIKSEEVALLPEGTYVETYGTQDGWTKVTSVGREGYIRNRDLTFVTDSSLFHVVNGHIVVNKKYGLPLSYRTVFDETAAAALRVMTEAMERDGLSIEVATTYRDASEEAKELVLRGNPPNAPEPGHAVFQTGYGVEFYVPGTDPRIDNHFSETEQYRWLSEHAHEYGFILRYPKGSEEQTGYREDDTVFYYVGIDDATAMYQTDLTMEEYY